MANRTNTKKRRLQYEQGILEATAAYRAARIAELKALLAGERDRHDADGKALMEARDEIFRLNGQIAEFARQENRAEVLRIERDEFAVNLNNARDRIEALEAEVARLSEAVIAAGSSAAQLTPAPAELPLDEPATKEPT